MEPLHYTLLKTDQRESRSKEASSGKRMKKIFGLQKQLLFAADINLGEGGGLI